MKIKKILALSALGLLATSCVSKVTDNAQTHVDKAFALAGDSFMQTTADLQCGTDNSKAMAFFKDKSAPPPMKVFDNLFYVGVNSVSSWALQTSDGIILIDALFNANDARNYIEGGLKTLGLDPASIKYIVVTHGHGDHYGGAAYLAEKYGARVLMSDIDWDLASKPRVVPQRKSLPTPKRSKAPTKDMVAVDGENLTLGNTTVNFVLTPGHTPGTLSLVFPVYSNGNQHMASLWGGTGVPKNINGASQYINSAEKFNRLSYGFGVDTPLSNHPFVDNSIVRMKKFADNKSSKNPFIIGKERSQDYMSVITECAKASLARLELDTK